MEKGVAKSFIGYPGVTIIIAALAAGFIVLLRSKIMEEREQRRHEHKFIEYVAVEGECFEDRVKQPASYIGNIVHWYNVSKDRHSRFGHVHNEESLESEKLSERIKDPYKYQPPFTISFSDLKEEEIAGDELHLKGMSQHFSGGERSGPRYRATCILRVINRLDHFPL